MNKIKQNLFGFFNGKLSPRFGKTCCRYGQDGKPLSIEKVDHIYQQQIEFIKEWKLNDQRTYLYRSLYFSDYDKLMEVVYQIYKIDKYSAIKNKPSFIIKNGDFLQIKLQSLPLKGLSGMDFELATRISNWLLEIKDDYVDIENEERYRRQAKLIIRKRESVKYQNYLTEAQKNNQNFLQQK